MTTAFLPQSVIKKKRDGQHLSEEEVRAFITGATDGTIPDYQIAAMLMAVYFRGLDGGELAVWADAMLTSGDRIDLSSVTRPKVDKHSTGGVGDKISLPLAPAVAACGAAVPMVSGRGLGHTGGTLDKLESIPGFKVDIPVDQFVRQVGELGVCLMGQTDRVAPADRRLYGLRDVTATVESIPLIASSIMSKKLAEGIEGLVLDVKVGDGAFMKSRAEAVQLARAIQSIGASANVKVTAVLTNMDAPIGRMVGNAVEVHESIEVLRGGGPLDSRELTVALGAEMLVLAGIASDPGDGKARIARVLDDGSALDLFRKVVEAQGGDPRVVDAPEQVLPRAEKRIPVAAVETGTVRALAAREIGMAALVLGAGRRRVADVVDPSAGVALAAHVGERIDRGQPVAFLLTSSASDEQIAAAHDLVAGAYRFGAAVSAPRSSLILEVLR
jgi:pyrimidine-nucleoside phosphorylase